MRASGNPVFYGSSDDNHFMSVAYDDHGDLLALTDSGYSGHWYYYPYFYYLPKKSAKLILMNLPGPSRSWYWDYAVNVAFDGKYWVVNSRDLYLYSINVQAQYIREVGLSSTYGGLGAVAFYRKSLKGEATQIIGPSDQYGGKSAIDFWKYPAGGGPIDTVTAGSRRADRSGDQHGNAGRRAMNARSLGIALSLSSLAACTGAAAPPPADQSAFNRATTSVARGPFRLHADRRRSWFAAELAHKQSSLLFVSDSGTADVYVYSLPALKLMATVTGFSQPQGECSDNKGNVWIADTNAQTMYELSHHGRLVYEIKTTGAYPVSCAWDATTGDLAVMSLFNGSGTSGDVLVYASGSGSGYRTRTRANIIMTSADTIPKAISSSTAWIPTATSSSPSFRATPPRPKRSR